MVTIAGLPLSIRALDRIEAISVALIVVSLVRLSNAVPGTNHDDALENHAGCATIASRVRLTAES